MSRYPLACTSWDEAEYEAMAQVVQSGRFSMGEHVAGFEQEFALHFGSRFCVMVNSGSSANLLMVAALFYRENKAERLAAGDEVIVPAVSWSTTYFPLHQYGLKLKFVDIDPATLNYDLAQLADAVSERTRLVMAVNLLGNPNDFAAIQTILAGKGVILIEDNCESMGAAFEGKMAGTFGLMGSFSSFFSHHISTMEGGMILTDDEELAHILLSLRAHGWTRNLPKVNRVCGVKGDNPFEESFRFVLPGYNVRPLELSGALGMTQIRKLSEFVRVRRENAAKFLRLMEAFPQLQVQREIGASSWFGFSLVVREDARFSREDVVRTLDGHGIECRPIVAGNFARCEAVRWLDATNHGSLAQADWIDRNGLFIGNHHYPLDEQFALLGEALKKLPC
ncbi:MAG: DegT/DnrJ/EryC1/StrS family aminotransferase [Deltaproteobacteria bacterium]|nr:DegT/DnrJ/EryC1/StrS family aminotransferase [Deltaproteobacteria bacterium]